MRADVYLASEKIAKSREEAKKAILAGNVTVDGIRITRPASDIDGTRPHEVEFVPESPFASRGGLKLDAALDAFRVDVSGLTAADVGASTGGFTDCLLRRGASRVFAIDSGHGQLDPALSTDPRVESLEGLNARYLRFEDVGALCDIAVIDVSFISQTLILPALRNILKPGARVISLIKPQFECGRAALGKKGIVKNASDREIAVNKVLESARSSGFRNLGIIESPVKGGDGNTEYLSCFQFDCNPVVNDE